MVGSISIPSTVLPVAPTEANRTTSDVVDTLAAIGNVAQPEVERAGAAVNNTNESGTEADLSSGQESSVTQEVAQQQFRDAAATVTLSVQDNATISQESASDEALLDSAVRQANNSAGDNAQLLPPGTLLSTTV